ncbi:ABC transporter substrate-binding protein [Micromonospora sp. NPDC023966]|uniref:ABC transporter substrate-binding protein n=1 Tax=Micromonospora sp. NPDC023966 TaxID=3154699 RepID=UPI0033D36426
MMRRLPLTLACGDYDRTRALLEGDVRPDGIDLTYLRLPVEETFFRMLRHREFDVAEMSLSTYAASLAREDRPFVALPVFTSRMFRHSSVYVREGITSVEELKGGVVGVPEFQLTACVWVRGILEEHHGLPASSVRYVTGGQESPGRIEKGAVSVPYDVSAIPSDRTLSQMLGAGEIDALYTPRVPSTFGAGVTRLFPDVVRAERAYFEATRIFPIMHVVVLRREVYEANRWVAQALHKSFVAARDLAYAGLSDSSALRFLSPWLVQHAEADRALLGDDFWSYGLDANRHVLEAFLRYHHAQGLSPRLLTPEELFAPETLESFVI